MYRLNNRIAEFLDLPEQPGDALARRVAAYLEAHPDVPREAFLRDAIEREIDLREQQENYSPAATPQEIRDHTWVEEQLATIRHEHHGFGERLRSLFVRH